MHYCIDMEGPARAGDQHPPMFMFGSNHVLLSHRRRIGLYLLIMATCKDCSSVRKSIAIASLLIFGKTSALIISKQHLHLSHHYLEHQRAPPNRSRAKAGHQCHPKALNLEAKSTLPYVNNGGLLESEKSISRKDVIAGLCAAALTVTASMCRANAETSIDGLGVVDDLLANCPSTPTCVSSQDDRPYPFMEPWTYEGPWDRAMSRLRSYLELDGAKVVASSPRYLRVEFEAVDALPSSVDDAEFYFTPGDALVQFRCARRSGFTDFGASRRRMDSIRIALQFESIPVLRNRKRTFIFGESPIDSFGPSFGNVDPSLMYRDTDPLSPPFEKPSDSMRERAEGSADRPVWWGKPFAEARGFADWEKPRRAPC